MPSISAHLDNVWISLPARWIPGINQKAVQSGMNVPISQHLEVSLNQESTKLAGITNRDITEFIRSEVPRRPGLPVAFLKLLWKTKMDPISQDLFWCILWKCINVRDELARKQILCTLHLWRNRDN
jgi:hypothetical protein